MSIKPYFFRFSTGIPERVPIRTYADLWRDYFSAGYHEEDGKRS